MASSGSPRTLVSFATGTAGTATALGGKQRLQAISIVGRRGNTKPVYLGGSDVTTAVNEGLAAGESVNWEFTPQQPEDLQNLYVVTEITGEGVNYYALKV